MRFFIISLIFWPFLGFSQIIKQNNDFLNILGILESNNNDYAVGDKGKSIGRFQIQRKCFEDACKFNKSINFSYESLTNKANSEIIVITYLSHYEKTAWKNNDYEKLAKCWNGGPNWRKKKLKAKDNLDKYWEKFKRYMVDNKRYIVYH
jgi:hypothetical protein